MRRNKLSSKCKLNPDLILAFLTGGHEHPCDHCDHDRSECKGYPRLDDNNKVNEIDNINDAS